MRRAPSAETGNGRLNLARALGDTATDSVKPAGAAPVGDGGPFVGPYDAAANNFNVSPATQNVAPGFTKSYSWAFTAQNSANQATTTFTTPAGWTAPTTAAGAGNVTVVAGTCPATLASVTSATRVITIDQGPGSNTCANGTTFTLYYNQATSPTSATAPEQTYQFVNQHGQDPDVTVEYNYFSNVSPSGNWNVAANWELCDATTGSIVRPSLRLSRRARPTRTSSISDPSTPSMFLLRLPRIRCTSPRLPR